MMFIGRKQDGTIYGSWTVRQPDDADHPLQEEVSDDHPDLVAFRTPKPPIDQSDLDNIEKRDKAILLCVAQVGGLTVQQMKALFAAKWNSLP